jgi:hypothetical protein
MFLQAMDTCLTLLAITECIFGYLINISILLNRWVDGWLTYIDDFFLNIIQEIDGTGLMCTTIFFILFVLFMITGLLTSKNHRHSRPLSLLDLQEKEAKYLWQKDLRNY